MAAAPISGTDVVSYRGSDGRPREAELVVAVGSDGQPTGSVQITARAVHTRNGVSTAGSWDIVPADENRTGLTIRNDSDAKMYFRTDGEAGDGVGYPMDAGRGYSFEALGMLPEGAVSVWCGTAGKRWAVLYSTTSEPYDA